MWTEGYRLKSFRGSNPNREPNENTVQPHGVFIWLGLSDLFQTFEDLESVVDKEAEIASIRELLGKDDAQQNDEKEPLC